MEHRTCFDNVGRGCGRTLPVTEFHRQGKNVDGSTRYHSLCKDCNNEKKREWREANPERVTAWNERDWRVHRDKRSARNRAYNTATREERAASERQRYRELNAVARARLLERQREWRRRNRATG